MNVYRVTYHSANKPHALTRMIRASKPSVAINRAIDGEFPAKCRGVMVSADFVEEVKYEYRIRADVKDHNGNIGGWTRTWLPGYGPYRTRKHAQLDINGIHSLPQVMDATWRYLKVDRIEVGTVK